MWSFLQGTHFLGTYQASFMHGQYPQFYLANAPDQTRGVAISISKQLSFSPLNSIKDPNSRYLLEGELVTFLTYYTPNAD